jgi:hypothetical protein
VAGWHSAEQAEPFISDDIEVAWSLGQEVGRTPGSPSGFYTHDPRRFREQAGGPGPRRILPAFFVCAHALLLGGRALLTTDMRIFSNYFPKLRLIASKGISSWKTPAAGKEIPQYLKRRSAAT